WHPESVRRARAARARALGRGHGAGGRRSRRLRLRTRARRLARPPGHQLDGRRRLPAPAQRPRTPPQPDRRHDVQPRPRGGEGSGGLRARPAPGGEPARRDDRVGIGDGGPAGAARRLLKMSSLLDIRRYPDVLQAFRWEALWELFDGDRDRLNLAHECVDRHPGLGTALRIKFDDGRSEKHSFQDLTAWSSRFAHLIARRGVERGDRVAVMLDPSLAFYGAVFGAVKRGAIAVPLFTLFGPDGVAARVED